MTRRLLAVGWLLALAVATVAGLAVAHGTHATANTQVSANGTLVVEQAFLSQPAYLVVRADDGGQPGRVLGYRPLSQGLYTGVTVRIDESAWQDLPANTTVWTVLHADDGDGEFDPSEDELLSWVGQPAGERVAVGKRSGAGYVVTGSGLTDTAGELSLERVALPTAGHVVVHERTNGSLGRVRGSRSLAAGTHSDVGVPVDLAGNQSDWPPLSIVIHADDGDGEFDGDEPVVRVAGAPVASEFGRDGRRTTDAPVGVNTLQADSGSGSSPATTTGEGSTTRSDGAGFGVGAAVAAVVALVLVGRR